MNNKQLFISIISYTALSLAFAAAVAWSIHRIHISKAEEFRIRSDVVGIYLDNETGCEYLIVSGGTSIFPRMDANGRQRCGKNPLLEKEE